MVDRSIFYDPAMYEEGCRMPSSLLPVTLEFLAFQSRCRALGFQETEILKLAKALAEKDLADGA